MDASWRMLCLEPHALCLGTSSLPPATAPQARCMGLGGIPSPWSPTGSHAILLSLEVVDGALAAVGHEEQVSALSWGWQVLGPVAVGLPASSCIRSQNTGDALVPRGPEAPTNHPRLLLACPCTLGTTLGTSAPAQIFFPLYFHGQESSPQQGAEPTAESKEGEQRPSLFLPWCLLPTGVDIGLG